MRTIKNKIIDNLNKKVVAMSFGRDRWVNKLDDKITGALGEFAKQKYADLVGFKGHCWTPEVKRLMKVVEDHIKNVGIKKGCDKQSAIDEAVMQAFTNQLKVTKARNKFANMSSEYSKKIGSISLGAGDLIKEMFKLYLSKGIENKINYPE